ncbi:MAG: hypothetical protein WBE26_15070 [Phycisphaerae bacterium]
MRTSASTIIPHSPSTAATDPEGEWSEDWAQVWVDSGAGQPPPDGHDLTELRTDIDQRVLANLLRLNLTRAGSR